MDETPKVIEKKKRGRKPNAEKLKMANLAKANLENNLTGDIENTEHTENIEKTENKNAPEVKIPKKRGRKPKGGKIIEANKVIDNKISLQQNIILHLKCNIKDLDSNIDNTKYESYKFNENKYNELEFNYFNDEKKNIYINSSDSNIKKTNIQEHNDINENIKTIWKKLDELTVNLHNNNISDKKSACFWCTYDFDNPPIFIPKYEFNNSYHVYGCFCSPECSSAYLMNENIDNATKFERYHLLNFIYSKIYDYKKNIKPAPNPLYILDKYYGNLNIQEYRQLLKNERLLLIVEKPLTRMLPELHEDNDEFMLNTNSISASVKYKIRKNTKNQSKTDILNENFKVQS